MIFGGIRAVDDMLTAEPPVVPDDATRVRITTGHPHTWFATTPEAARAFLGRTPSAWGPRGSVASDHGAAVAHAAYTDAGMGRYVLWTDGMLEEGSLVTPPGVEPGEANRAWRAAQSRAPHLEPLLDRLVHTENLGDLDRGLLAGWTQDTQATPGEPAVVLTASRPVVLAAQPRELHRTVHVTTWVVATPGQPRRELHIAEDLYTLSPAHPSVVWQREALWAGAGLDAARAVAEEWAVDRRAGWTRTEAAAELGITEAALRQAHHRATQQRRRLAHTVAPRTHPRLYRLADLRRMLDERPGHGPGRGHRS